jgi:hypothetical protein
MEGSFETPYDPPSVVDHWQMESHSRGEETGEPKAPLSDGVTNLARELNRPCGDQFESTQTSPSSSTGLVLANQGPPRLFSSHDDTLPSGSETPIFDGNLGGRKMPFRLI